MTLQPDLHSIATAGLSLKIGTGAAGTRRITIGLGQYGGDWDSARHALTFLSHQLRERTRLAINASDRVIPLDSPELASLPFVYITGHRDFTFTTAEVENLRAYLQAGGYLWADDSTHFHDQTFDTAFRRELARLLPGSQLERLDHTFEAFSTGYDLTKGYKGYAIPPGDKYRLDYLEGVRLGERVAVVYTRNDYGDGLNIDAFTHPIHESLTDLSPAEMQEGAIRMGVNLTLYFMTHGRGEASFIDHTAATMRSQSDTSTPSLPQGPSRPLPLFQSDWQHAPWSDPGTFTRSDATVTIDFQLGPHEKSAFSSTLETPLTLTAHDTVLLEVESHLRSGARLALAFTINGRYFESRPVFIKPGSNQALFHCDEPTFKTEAGNWVYQERLPATAPVAEITLLIYSPTPGRLHLTQPRLYRK